MTRTLPFALSMMLTTAALAGTPPSDFVKVTNSPSKFSFTENKGQVSDQHYLPRPDVRYYGSQGPMDFHITDRGISYQLRQVESWRVEKQHGPSMEQTPMDSVPDRIRIRRVDIRWPGSDPNAAWINGDTLPDHTNYYLQVCPDGVTDVRSYQGVTRKNIYPGIDLKYYSTDGRLKYDYIVAPGTSADVIRLEVHGAQVSLLPDGSVKLSTPLGDLIEEAPVCFQQGKAIKASWTLSGKTLSFDIPDRDPNVELVIDPSIRLGGTYYGGESVDAVEAVKVLPDGDLIITGNTWSDFAIATAGTHDTTINGLGDGFVAKMNGTADRIWGTYFGGSGYENVKNAVVTSTDRTMVCGYSNSTAGIASQLAAQLTSGGGYDAFLVVFNNATGTRTYGTYYGGAGTDHGYGLCRDENGNMYLGGSTESNSGISTPGSHIPVIPAQSGTTGFLVKFDGSGGRVWGTYLNGEVNGMDLGANAEVYLAGRTDRETGIATTNAHQAQIGGGFTDGFICRFNGNGTQVWSTYYGGGGTDQLNAITVDPDGNVVACGYTDSNTGIATLSPNYSGTRDGFITKFTASGTRLWGRYFGGNGSDELFSCDTDIAGSIHVCGETQSTSGIATNGAHQALFGGEYDGYFGRFKPDGTLMNASYYGGANTDRLYSIAVTPGAFIHVAGESESGNNISTTGAWFTNYQGSYDGILASFCTTQEAWVTTTLETCAGAADGSIAVQLTGGGLTNSITLNGEVDLGSSALFTDLGSTVPGAVTEYDLSFSSIIGSCSGAAPAMTILMYGPPPLTTSLVGAFVTCPGTATGGVNAMVEGGTPPYTYAWSNGATTMNISDVVAGVYSQVVTDANGCTATSSGTVTELPPILPTIVSTQDPLCNGDTSGSIDLDFTGGVPPITFAWSDGSQIADPTGLAAGVYTVVITDQFDCEATASATLTDPPALFLTVTVTNENVGNDGAVDLQVAGGTPPYTYIWSNGSTGQDLAGLAGGTYSVEVTDANGCLDDVNVVVNSFVGVEEIEGGLEWAVTLDRNAQLLTITADKPFKAIELFDASGRFVLSQQKVASVASMSVGHLSSGVYLVRLGFDEGPRVKRLFIGR